MADSNSLDLEGRGWGAYEKLQPAGQAVSLHLAREGDNRNGKKDRQSVNYNRWRLGVRRDADYARCIGASLEVGMRMSYLQPSEDRNQQQAGPGRPAP